MSTPGPTTQYTTNKESRNTRRGNRKVKFRRGNEGGASCSEQKDFKGETPEINAVLGIITKRLEQGVTFDKLQDVLKNYFLNDLIKSEDIVEIITDLKGPVTNVDTKHIPDDLTKKEEESKIKMTMWEIRVKRYINREEILIENTNKLYGIVIGQCTPALRATIKGDAEYEKMSSYFDTLWLLKKINKTTTGVDMKANPDLTLHDRIIIFLTTK